MYNYVLSSGLLLTLWDPIDATRVNKLESVQNLQLGLSPGDGPTTNNSLLSHLNWPKLSTRRSRNFCYATTFLSACSMLPRSLFTPPSIPTSCTVHTTIPLFCTVPLVTQLLIFPHLFSALWLPLWNCLPMDVVCAPSLYS